MRPPSPAVALALALLAGCADEPASGGPPWEASTSGLTAPHDSTAADTTADTGTDADSGLDTTGDDDPSTGEPACPWPDLAPAWVTPLQADLVARLSGADELAPGVVLTDRASLERRAAALDFMADQWSALGLRPQLHAYSPSGTNLYAVLPATAQTDQAVVIGAHFDTVPGSPGANDNATGVAMVTSLARWLPDLPCRERHVILVLFDEEELGLLGSQAFAAWLLGQPYAVISVHTIDQMGWDDDGDRAVELERPDDGLFELYEQAEPLAPGSTPLVPTDTGLTDHVSFRAVGLAAVGLTEEFASGDTTPHYHLPSDTFDTVDLDYLASSTALLHAAIGTLLAPPQR